MKNDEHFVRLRHHVESALKYSGGTHTVDDVEEGIRLNNFQIWPGVNSVIITEIIVYPRLKDLHFFLAGGDLNELKSMVPFIEKWGESIGCSRVSLAGRKGWEKTFLKDDGYKPMWFVLCKDLKG